MKQRKKGARLLYFVAVFSALLLCSIVVFLQVFWRSGERLYPFGNALDDANRLTFPSANGNAIPKRRLNHSLPSRRKRDELRMKAGKLAGVFKQLGRSRQPTAKTVSSVEWLNVSRLKSLYPNAQWTDELLMTESATASVELFESYSRVMTGSKGLVLGLGCMKCGSSQLYSESLAAFNTQKPAPFGAWLFGWHESRYWNSFGQKHGSFHDYIETGILTPRNNVQKQSQQLKVLLERALDKSTQAAYLWFDKCPSYFSELAKVPFLVSVYTHLFSAFATVNQLKYAAYLRVYVVLRNPTDRLWSHMWFLKTRHKRWSNQKLTDSELLEMAKEIENSLAEDCTDILQLADSRTAANSNGGSHRQSGGCRLTCAFAQLLSEVRRRNEWLLQSQTDSVSHSQFSDESNIGLIDAYERIGDKYGVPQLYGLKRGCYYPTLLAYLKSMHQPFIDDGLFKVIQADFLFDAATANFTKQQLYCFFHAHKGCETLGALLRKEETQTNVATAEETEKNTTEVKIKGHFTQTEMSASFRKLANRLYSECNALTFALIRDYDNDSDSQNRNPLLFAGHQLVEWN